MYAHNQKNIRLTKFKRLIFVVILTIAGQFYGKIHYQTLDSNTMGSIETINNIVNVSIISKNSNDYKAEYNAGFMQGKLQNEDIKAARDNSWQGAYLGDPTHTLPKTIPPSAEDFSWVQETLSQNLQYTLNYIKNCQNQQLRHNIRRLMYRLIGIYHGATNKHGPKIKFNETWLPVFTESELALGYGKTPLTFLDLYFINSIIDTLYLVKKPTCSTNNLEKCSAFIKKTADDIFLAHNTWYYYLSQTMALTFYINGDYLCVNMLCPGLLCSGSDFGYNNKGIMFNETTVNFSYNKPKIDALWMFWRAALAEQFASSLDEFYYYVALEASGTQMNSYMIIDTKTDDIGLVEMSYQSFIYYKSTESGYAIITKPENLDTTYDKEMIQPDYIFGVNYPASYLIRNELQSKDTRPARKEQLVAKIKSVNDIESAKALITYTDPCNPLSIYGRWDLGYGKTPTPKVIPEGATDAKAVAASSIKYTENLKGTFEAKASNKIFWMKFGTPEVNGKPFIWSQSQWRGWPLLKVQDALEGPYTLLSTPIN